MDATVSLTVVLVTVCFSKGNRFKVFGVCLKLEIRVRIYLYMGIEIQEIFEN